MEQVVIIAVIALISFVNWLVKVSREARHRKAEEERRLRGDTAEEPAPAPLPSAPTRPVAQEEQMRKFLEALGLPTEDAPTALPPFPKPAAPEPPPLPQPVPARRAVVAALQPVVAAAAPQAELTQPIFTTRVPSRSPEIAAAAARFASATSTGARTDDYRFHFPDNARALRDAIVMREILGPPKALQHGA